MSVGKRLKTLRESKGLSQYKLANLSGIERSTLIRTEQGLVEPRISTLRKIAKALKVEVSEFLR